jgi:hypothetical protein
MAVVDRPPECRDRGKGRPRRDAGRVLLDVERARLTGRKTCVVLGDPNLVWAIGVLSLAAVPLQRGPPVVVLTANFAGVGLVNPIFNTNLLALVQTPTPPPLLGRITGTSRFLTWGVLPIGAALGGQIADHLGLRTPIVVAGGLSFAAFVLLATSPIRSITSVAAAARLSVARFAPVDHQENTPGNPQEPDQRPRPGS